MVRILLLFLLPGFSFASCSIALREGQIMNASQFLLQERHNPLNQKKYNAIRFLSFYTDELSYRVLVRELVQSPYGQTQLAIRQALEDIDQMRYLRKWKQAHD